MPVLEPWPRHWGRYCRMPLFMPSSYIGGVSSATEHVDDRDAREISGTECIDGSRAVVAAGDALGPKGCWLSA